MKKTICLTLCCILLICSSACVIDAFEGVLDAIFFTSHTITGLENFSECENSPILNFLPNGEKLWEKHDCMEGDFYYRKETFISASEVVHEEGLVYLIYDDETYQSAKQFTLENLDAASKKLCSYNNYCFYGIALDYSEKGMVQTPVSFVLTVLNDESNTILFLGFYASPPLDEDAQEVLDQVAKGNVCPFLEKYFSIYDFGE